jgi:hypothetical protein
LAQERADIEFAGGVRRKALEEKSAEQGREFIRNLPAELGLGTLEAAAEGAGQIPQVTGQIAADATGDDPLAGTLLGAVGTGAILPAQLGLNVARTGLGALGIGLGEMAEDSAAGREARKTALIDIGVDAAALGVGKIVKAVKVGRALKAGKSAAKAAEIGAKAEVVANRLVDGGYIGINGVRTFVDVAEKTNSYEEALKASLKQVAQSAATITGLRGFQKASTTRGPATAKFTPDVRAGDLSGPSSKAIRPDAPARPAKAEFVPAEARGKRLGKRKLRRRALEAQEMAQDFGRRLEADKALIAKEKPTKAELQRLQEIADELPAQIKASEKAGRPDEVAFRKRMQKSIDKKLAEQKEIAKPVLEAEARVEAAEAVPLKPEDAAAKAKEITAQKAEAAKPKPKTRGPKQKVPVKVEKVTISQPPVSAVEAGADVLAEAAKKPKLTAKQKKKVDQVRADLEAITGKPVAELTQADVRAGLKQMGVPESDFLKTAAKAPPGQVGGVSGQPPKAPTGPADLPDAKAAKQGTWYHGTANRDIPQLESKYSKAGLFGTGVYMTDDPKVASSYAKTGGKVVVSKVTPKRVLNLEAPLPKDAKAAIGDWLNDSGFADNLSQETLKVMRKKSVTGEQAMTAILADIAADAEVNRLGAGEMAERMGDLELGLRDKGYDALTHIGGKRVGKKRGGPQHRVLIMLDPEDTAGKYGKTIASSEGRESSDFLRTAAKAPPGQVGGVAGQPPADAPKTPIRSKSVRTIGKLRKQGDLTDGEFNDLVTDASGGRTADPKALSADEGAKLESRLDAIRKARAAEATEEQRLAVAARRRPATEAEAEAADVAPVEAAAEVKKIHGSKFERTPGTTQKRGVLERAKRSGVGQFLTTDQNSYESLAQDAVGKGSKASKILVDDLREARTQKQSMKAATDERMQKAMATQGIKFKDLEGRSEALGGKAKREPVKLESGESLSLTAAEYARIAWLAKDGKAKKSLTRDGISTVDSETPVRLTTGDIDAITKHVNDNHKPLVTMYNSMFQDANSVIGDMVAREYWKDMGVKLPQSGEYVHITRDPRYFQGRGLEAGDPMAQFELFQADLLKSMSGVDLKKPKLKARPGIRRKGKRGDLSGESIVQARTGGGPPIIIRDMFHEWANFVEHSTSYLAKNRPHKAAKRVLSSPEFRQAMTGAYSDGDLRLRQMTRAADDFAGVDYSVGTNLDKVANGLLRNASRGLLGGKALIPLYQPVSYINAASEIPAKHLVSALLDPVSLKKGGRAALDAEIKKHAPEIHARVRGSAHEIMSPFLTPGNTTRTRLAFGAKPKLGSRVLDAPMVGIHFMDSGTVKKLYQASKLWAKADGFEGEAMLAEAGKRAQRAIDRTQPSWDTLTMSQVQREAKGSPMRKVFSMFASQPSKNLNMMARAISDYRQGNRSAGAKLKLMKEVLIPSLVNATLVYGISEGGRRVLQGTGEKSYQKHIADVAEKMTGGWLGASQVLGIMKRGVEASFSNQPEFAVKRRGNVMTAIGDEAMSLVFNLSKTIQEKINKGQLSDKRAVEMALSALRSSSLLLGLPGGAVEQFLRGPLRESVKKKRSRLGD